MAQHLNTNKQFMIGNGILAFAVIFVVVIFVYMSLRESRKDHPEKKFAETYSITLTRGFAGESVSVYVNDSLLLNGQITEEPVSVAVNRFAESSAVMIVDNETEKMAMFDLSEKGGEYSFVKDEDGVKQLPN